MQDWDLLLEHLPYEDLYLELAASKTCPKADYFLALLYLIVGDAVRTEYQNRSKEAVEDLLRKAERDFPAFVICTWIQRSRVLLAQPQTFDYDRWCAGGWVYRPEE